MQAYNFSQWWALLPLVAVCVPLLYADRKRINRYTSPRRTTHKPTPYKPQE